MIYITGANGWIGLNLIKNIVQKKYHNWDVGHSNIHAFILKGSSKKNLRAISKDINIVEGDLLDKFSLEKFLEKSENGILFHTAGIIHPKKVNDFYELFFGDAHIASKELGISQSAASAAIATIEDIYQVKLFDRVGRSVFLSDLGKRFLPEAQSAIASAKNATKMLRMLSEKTSGSLQIAASQTIASYWLPRRLAAFNNRNPAVAINVAMSNTRGVETAVLEGKADIGFVEGKVNANGLRLLKVDQDQPILVVSPKKWPIVRPSIKEGNIGNLPWIVREKGSGTRRVLEDLIVQNNLNWDSLDIILELPSNEAVREAVIAGSGVTLISQQVVNLSIESGLLRSVAMDLPPRSYTMLLRKKRALSSAEKAFTTMINENAIIS